LSRAYWDADLVRDVLRRSVVQHRGPEPGYQRAVRVARL